MVVKMVIFCEYYGYIDDQLCENCEQQGKL